MLPLSRAALLASALLLPSTVSAVSFDCKIREQNIDFDFNDLAGTHVVQNIESAGLVGGIFNTSYSVSLCKPLDVPKNKAERARACGDGTHVCRIASHITEHDDDVIGLDSVVRNYAIEGYKIEPKYDLLSEVAGNKDQDKEGVRVTFNGGKTDKKKSMRAIIDFICPPEEKRRRRSVSAQADDDEEGGDGDNSDNDPVEDDPKWKEARKTEDGQGGTLEFIDWKTESDVWTLRMDWTTKKACFDAAKRGDGGSGSGGGGWGFFSFFFLFIFLGLVGYFGFFAWINYSKYGAHGWDLVPHSDTIRDLPYILGDWGRKVIGTFTGGPSRGGYSAV